MRKTIIIAEAGVNHNGDISLAKKLIDAGAEAGADYVKFQTFKSSKLVSKSAKTADYQKKNLKTRNESQLKMLQKLEIDEATHYVLKDYCEQKGTKFLSTGFDLESLDFLNEFGLPLFKIPSGELTNLPYLRKVASFGKHIVLSTGMANIEEIEDAIEVVLKYGRKKNDITVLHCNTEYPTPMQDVNLNAMLTIAERIKTKVGYSDHTLGIEVPIAAVALGATVIEKHFTLDRNLDGPDHRASLEPLELKQMIMSIRNIEAAMGNGVKEPSESELKNIEVVRKSIVASKNIKRGEVFSADNLTVKRPGNGISPMRWDEIVGTVSQKNYQEDDLI